MSNKRKLLECNKEDIKERYGKLFLVMYTFEDMPFQYWCKWVPETNYYISYQTVSSTEVITDTFTGWAEACKDFRVFTFDD